MKDHIKEFIIEKDLKRTWKQKILHTLCLIIPIISAFAGYYLSPFIFSVIFQGDGEELDVKQISETAKFLVTLIFFAIPSIIIFVKSRNTNPIMKIRVSSKEE